MSNTEIVKHVVMSEYQDAMGLTDELEKHRAEAAAIFKNPQRLTSQTSSKPVIVNPEHDPAANVHTGEYTYSLLTTWQEGPETLPGDQADDEVE